MNQTQSDQNLDHLINVYRTSEADRFALFLGAGVNGGEWAREHPACFSWPKLLKEVAGHFHQQNVIDIILEESRDDWVKAGTSLFGEQNREAVLDQIDHAIYRDTFTHPEKRTEMAAKHKVLEWKVFRNMETLRAVVAFSAAINKTTKKYSTRRNPKVGRVLTTNYDFFFGAAWPRYTSMKESWWPRTGKSKSTDHGSAHPIIYLHGYLPYSQKGGRDLILIEADYRRTYPPTEENAGFAFYELEDAIESCHLIFVGFSFADQEVSKVLKNSNSSRTHFAFFHQDEFKAMEAAGQADVLPITVNEWPELPEKLSQVYCAGLSQRELERTNVSRTDYWSRLLERQEPRK